jgi:hypothetical protein
MTSRDGALLAPRSAGPGRAIVGLALGLLESLAPACAAAPPESEPVAAAVEPLTWNLQGKLFGDNEQALDRFGYGVAASGNTFLLTARFGGDAAMRTGAAYVFVWSGSTWSQEARLPTPVEANDGLSGKAALSGDTLVVGATGDHDAGKNSGAAYVFARENGVWSQEARLLAPDGAAADVFGSSVAIEGDTIVIGAVQKSEAGSQSGAAYVFTRSDGLWTLQKKLVPGDGKALDYFGKSVAITGDTIVVGAYGCDDLGAGAGAAYLFTRSGASWGPATKVFAPEVTDGDRFGILVAAAGDTIVVAADREDDAAHGKTDVGAAYAFTRSGATWGSPQRLLANDGESGHRLGVSLATSGETIVVGAGNDAEAGSEAAYVFARRDGVWREKTKLVSVDGSPTDRFGLAVAVSGDFIAVGAPYDDSLGPPDSGTVHMFRQSLDDGEACVDAGRCSSGHCVEQICCASAFAAPGGRSRALRCGAGPTSTRSSTSPSISRRGGTRGSRSMSIITRRRSTIWRSPAPRRRAMCPAKRGSSPAPCEGATSG